MTVVHLKKLNSGITGLLLFLFMLLAASHSHAEPEAKTAISKDLPGLYVISLASSLDQFSTSNISKLPAFDNYRLYTTRFEKDGKLWYRLRLGFFTTKEQAQTVSQSLSSQYPQSWITKISTNEKELSSTTTIIFSPSTTVVQQANVAPAEVTTLTNSTTLSNERLAQYMEEARQSMANSDYPRAINIYTRILEYPDHPYLQDAQEFLGLARERKGQLAHAKTEYEKYLTLYPEGEGAERVRQRLAGLMTAKEPEQEKLREAKKLDAKSEWQTFGSASQYYRHDASSTDSTGDTINQSMLASDLDISSRLRSADHDLRARFTGGYDWDFLDRTESEFRVSSLYVEASDRQRNLSGRAGRQSGNKGGVLGRFDGLLLDYQVTPVVKANIVTGFPVESSHLDEIRTNKDFYGVSFDFGTFSNAWDVNTFIIQQDIDGISDRQAVGGEIRYFEAKRSFLSLVDYDISYSALNTILLTGNWTLPDQTTFSFVIDHRKSPILTTSNALQGQAVATVKELLSLFSEDEIRALAQDRTPDSRSYTLGASRPINTKFQISGDITITNLSSTPASGGVEAIESTGNDYFYSVQLTGNDLIKEGDLGILGLRYSDTSTAATTTLTLNTRYPVNRDWRINPRLRLDLRQFNTDNTEQWTIAPSVRVNYRWRKQTQFELETGGEWSDHKLTDTTEKTSGYFAFIGYRYDF